MKTAVSIYEILDVLDQKFWRNKMGEEVTLKYSDFKKALIGGGLYVSDPSIRNAWLRLESSAFCVGTSRANPRLGIEKSMTVELSRVKNYLLLNSERAKGEA